MPPKVGERNAYAGIIVGSQSATPVAAQQIWSEHVEKELRFQTVRSEYTRNPATVLLLPEKPSDPRRALALRRDAQAETDRAQLLDSLRLQDPQAHADVVGRLQRAEQPPREKYSAPLTTSQEIGWDQDFAARHAFESSQFVRPISNGDVTDFANSYVYQHGFNPFSSKQFKHMPRNAHPNK